MADSESGYKVGPCRPPLHTRFKKGQSGNPGGRSAKSLPALLADALNETVVVTIDGRRRKITKREAHRLHLRLGIAARYRFALSSLSIDCTLADVASRERRSQPAVGATL